MKIRRSLLRSLIPAFAIFLISCSSSVTINALVPAEADMSMYRTIAVEKTEIPDAVYYSPSMHQAEGVSYDGLLTYTTDRNFSYDVASSASSMIASALLDSGYFNVTVPEDTEGIKKIPGYATALEALASKGIDAVVSSSISRISWDEYVYSEPVYTKVYSNYSGFASSVVSDYNFFLCQELVIDMSVTVTDTKTGSVIVTRTLTDECHNETPLYGSSTGVPDLKNYADGIISGFATKTACLLAPHYETSKVTLLNNSPSDSQAVIAYQNVENGNLEKALEIFTMCWKQSSHVPSGYNAAVILQAKGMYEKAMAMIDEVCTSSGNGKAKQLRNAFLKAEKNRKKASRQIDDANAVAEIRDKS